MEDTLEFELRWSRHQNMIILSAPIDAEYPAGKPDLHIAARSSGSGGGYPRCAGCRTAGARYTSSSLPYAQLDRAFGDDFRQRYIRAFRKKAVVLKLGSECRQIIAASIRNPENAMRIAHIDHARLFEHAAIRQWESQLNRARV